MRRATWLLATLALIVLVSSPALADRPGGREDRSEVLLAAHHGPHGHWDYHHHPHPWYRGPRPVVVYPPVYRRPAVVVPYPVYPPVYYVPGYYGPHGSIDYYGRNFGISVGF